MRAFCWFLSLGMVAVAGVVYHYAQQVELACAPRGCMCPSITRTTCEVASDPIPMVPTPPEFAAAEPLVLEPLTEESTVNEPTVPAQKVVTLFTKHHCCDDETTTVHCPSARPDVCGMARPWMPYADELVSITRLQEAQRVLAHWETLLMGTRNPIELILQSFVSDTGDNDLRKAIDDAFQDGSEESEVAPQPLMPSGHDYHSMHPQCTRGGR